MMRTGFKVVSPVLFHLRLEPGNAPPVDVLTAIVGEHLFGWLIFAGSNAKNLQDVFSRVTAKEVRTHDETRIIIHEADQIGITAAEPERKDVRLPHLVGSGSLKEAGTNQIAPRLRRRFDQALLFKRLTNRLGAGLQEEYPPKQLRYSFDSPGRLFLFEFNNLFADRLGQTGPGSAIASVLQAFFAVQPITPHPLGDRRDTGPGLLRD
jgi:hypothetical protein